ncbi:unnamed protein product [Effrenium voratum]|uniref:Uncharacterized protein n=1 Tax=Effrenium voratum TaxID=2562239 RepID=A0AA36J1H4_9DINO|nr:unnamed protein product [Effrenium voratum]
MSYAEARKRGWGGPPTNRWRRYVIRLTHEVQEFMEQAPEGNGRARLLTGTHQGGLPAFAQSKQFPQQQNAWNEHQKAMGGQGYSQAHIRAAYQPCPEQAVPTAAAVCEPGTHGTNTRRQWAGKATHRHTSARLTSLYRFLAGMALACLLEAAVVA